MKVNVTVDLEDFFNDFNESTISQVVAEQVKDEIMKTVKRDPRYKEFVNKKAKDMLNNLEI